MSKPITKNYLITTAPVCIKPFPGRVYQESSAISAHTSFSNHLCLFFVSHLGTIVSSSAVSTNYRSQWQTISLSCRLWPLREHKTNKHFSAVTHRSHGAAVSSGTLWRRRDIRSAARRDGRQPWRYQAILSSHLPVVSTCCFAVSSPDLYCKEGWS